MVVDPKPVNRRSRVGDRGLARSRASRAPTPHSPRSPTIRWALGVALVVVAFYQVAIAQPDPPRRIISVIPALTEMLFAIGAGPQVVGVSSFDRQPPEVRALPRVGGLIDPSIERIILLRPDLVILYASQSDPQEQLARAQIPVFSYAHGGLAHVTETIRTLGARTGRPASAERVAASIERRLEAIRESVKGRERPRTLLVLDREPLALRNIYASGGIGFLHDMLDVAGGTNVFADIERESVQPTTETILTTAPDVIIEVRVGADLTAERIDREHRVWQTLAGVPAVRQGRVYILTGGDLVVPGPRVAEATDRLARVLRGEF